jgi:hypothetical protein
MSDEAKRIIVDDDWKAQAQREKEKLAEQSREAAGPRGLPEASFIEIVNLLAMQAMAGLGLLATSGGQRIPPDLAIAKHFIDLIQTLDDKSRGNLTPDEKRTLDEVLYEVRMRYVQMTSGGAPAPGAAADARRS